MRRIGREPTPEENAYRYAVESPVLLDELAANLFESVSGLGPRDAHDEWQAMPEQKRATWHSRTLGVMRDHMQLLS